MATPYDLINNDDPNRVSSTQYPSINGQQPIVDQNFGTPQGTPTNNILPNFNNSTGQQIGQYYGVQLAPGQVGFGNNPPGSTAPPTGGNTTPGATGGPAVAGGNNPYAAFINQATPEGQKARAWEFTQKNGTREQNVFNNLQQGTGDWQNGMSITSPQAWQNFKFTDPNMSQWMKNANMIDNPLDRFRYMFGADTGGATGHNESKMAMIKAGLDPQVANRLADVFAGNTEGAQYAQGLGLSGNWRNQEQNMFQLGNQLWGVKNGQRYLVKDFGGNNWESGHQIDRHRAGGPDWRPGEAGATGNQSLMDWYGQYEKDNPSQWFRNSNQSPTPGTPGTAGYGQSAPVATAAVNTQANITPEDIARQQRIATPYRITRSYQ